MVVPVMPDSFPEWDMRLVAAWDCLRRYAQIPTNSEKLVTDGTRGEICGEEKNIHTAAGFSIVRKPRSKISEWQTLPKFPGTQTLKNLQLPQMETID